MPPSVLVVAPAVVAVVLFIRRYYFKNPVRRVTDPNFAAAGGAIFASFVYICVTGFKTGAVLLAWLCLAVTWGLMIPSIVLTLRGLPDGDNTDPDFRM